MENLMEKVRIFCSAKQEWIVKLLLGTSLVSYYFIIALESALRSASQMTESCKEEQNKLQDRGKSRVS